MLGAYLSLTHVRGCVAGPQSFSTLPHEMLIPPSCIQCPQLAPGKWLQQFSELDGNGGSSPLFSPWAHLRFKCPSPLDQFWMPSHNLQPPLFYDVKSSFFSLNLRSVQPAQSAFQSSWPITERLPPAVNLQEKLRQGVSCKVDLQK